MKNETAARELTEARKLYDACPTPKPAWDQLGDVTRSVWLEKVQAGVTPNQYRGTTQKTKTYLGLARGRRDPGVMVYKCMMAGWLYW